MNEIFLVSFKKQTSNFEKIGFDNKEYRINKNSVKTDFNSFESKLVERASKYEEEIARTTINSFSFPFDESSLNNVPSIKQGLAIILIDSGFSIPPFSNSTFNFAGYRIVKDFFGETLELIIGLNKGD